ncbi:GNAT family N-acetyltransferase [Arthrobacter sp. NPDC090010]|uniref:GNAT family N-acetyltransferase n=1 Tax=Arthrobacter sp. NPDC090010 TaxID=3363942 RepID=UPI0038213D14
MVPPVTLRSPVPSDADALASLHVRCWHEAYGALLPDDFFTEEVLESRRRLWTRLCAAPQPGRTVRVAEAGGELVGFSAGGTPLDPSDGALGQELSSLYLLQDFHGSGAGQALFDAVLMDGPAFLWVAARNPRAQAFYRRNGFTPDGATDTDAHFGGMEELRMTRS